MNNALLRTLSYSVTASTAAASIFSKTTTIIRAAAIISYKIMGGGIPAVISTFRWFGTTNTNQNNK